MVYHIDILRYVRSLIRSMPYVSINDMIDGMTFELGTNTHFFVCVQSVYIVVGVVNFELSNRC